MKQRLKREGPAGKIGCRFYCRIRPAPRQRPMAALNTPLSPPAPFPHLAVCDITPESHLNRT